MTDKADKALFGDRQRGGVARIAIAVTVWALFQGAPAVTAQQAPDKDDKLCTEVFQSTDGKALDLDDAAQVDVFLRKLIGTKCTRQQIRDFMEAKGAKFDQVNKRRIIFKKFKWVKNKWWLNVITGVITTKYFFTFMENDEKKYELDSNWRYVEKIIYAHQDVTAI